MAEAVPPSFCIRATITLDGGGEEAFVTVPPPDQKYLTVLFSVATLLC
jgi:hypothetical protein